MLFFCHYINATSFLFLLCFRLASLLLIWRDNDRQHYFSNKHLLSLRWNILMWLDDKVSLNLKCIFSVCFFFNIQFKSMAVKGLKIRFRMHNVIKYLSRNVAHQLYNTFIIRFYSNAFDEYCQIEAVTRKKINQCFDDAKRTFVFFSNFWLCLLNSGKFSLCFS